MKKYGEYSSIGLPWYPNGAPPHWKILRHKNVLTKHKELVGENSDKYKLLSLTLNGVIIRDISEGKGKFSKDYDKYVVVNEGDLVFCLFDVDETPRTVGLSKHYGMITGAYDVFTPHDINSDYFFYYYLALDNKKLLKPLYTGLRKVIAYPTFAAIKFPVPPRSEQDHIVRYLDYKTAKIDKLISGYKRQIELLEERKQTIIDQCSTQGIDKTVKFKKSGTHWLSEIPEHWNTIPAKRLFFESKEKKHSTDYPATASRKYGIILQEEYMKKENKRIVIANQGLEDWKHVNPDYFVISLRSFQGGIERSTISGCVTWHYVVLIPQANVYPPYFKWLLKSKSYIKALQGTSDFIRDGQDLRYANFAKVSLPIVPLDEQKRIADYIENQISKIDTAIPIIEKQIALLQEYRTRLISDVVTGQVDVRDEVIPETEVN